MAITIANDDECLESSTLTSTSLFLYGTNLKVNSLLTRVEYLHDFIFEFRKEKVDNLVFFDRQ